jgi:hypothetical protein
MRLVWVPKAALDVTAPPIEATARACAVLRRHTLSNRIVFSFGQPVCCRSASLDVNWSQCLCVTVEIIILVGDEKYEPRIVPGSLHQLHQSAVGGPADSNNSQLKGRARASSQPRRKRGLWQCGYIRRSRQFDIHSEILNVELGWPPGSEKEAVGRGSLTASDVLCQ